MNISGWHVDGYGVFADHDVDGLGAGLTVVHGPNEAGKSTLLDFLRDMLFGFADRRHKRPMHEPLRGGRHGGTLGLRDADGGVWRLERYAGRQGATLTGPGGLLGGEAELRQLLGGVDAEVFRNVFAFGLGELASIDSLERDEIRELVFSAGVLGAGRSATKAIQAFTDQQARIVRPRRQDALANQLRKRIDEIGSELRALRADAAAYPARARAATTFAAAAAEARETLDDLRRHLSDLNQLESSWPVSLTQGETLRALSLLPAPSEEDARLLAATAAVRELAKAASGHEERVERLEKVQLELAEVKDAINEELGLLGGGIELARAAELAVDVGLRDQVRSLAADEPLARGRAISAQDQLNAARRALEAAEQTWRSRLEQSGSDLLDAGALERIRDAALELRGCVRDRDAIETERTVAEQHERLARLAEPTPRSSSSIRWISGAMVVSGVVLGVVTALEAGKLGGAALIAGSIALVLVVLASLLGATSRRADRHLVGAEPAPPREPLGVDIDRLRQRIAELAAICRVAPSPSIAEVDAALRRNEEDRDRRGAISDLERARDDAATRVSDAVAQLADARTGLAAIVAATGSIAATLNLPMASSARAIAEAVERFSTLRELQRRLLVLDPAEAMLVEAGRRYDEAVHVLADEIAGRERARVSGSDSVAVVNALERRVGELADRAERRAILLQALRSADAELERSAGLVRDTKWLQAELEIGDTESWTRLRRELEGRLHEATEEYERRVRAQRDAERELEELETSDAVASLALESAALEEELASALEHFAVLGCARALLEETLSRYERERQPVVIARAAALFSKVTDGRYHELVARADPDGGRRHGIEAITAQGQRIDSGDLSRGTAEQLYLCLRLALATNFAGGSVALPLVLDDVLVNFDPGRATAVARVVAEVATTHQILAFTCHPHVAELLCAAAPTGRVVELERRR